MTPAELADYYAALLIIQYAAKPKAQATVTALSSAVIANLITQQVQAAFDMSTAQGVQLDTLGLYLGARRALYGLSLGKNFMQFISAHTSPVTWGAYYGFAPCSLGTGVGWYWLTSADLANTGFVMSDGQFQQFLAYLAALYAVEMTLQNVDNFLYEFFGKYVTLVDNGNMTVTYNHDHTDPSPLFSIINYVNLLPRPCGVAYNVVTT